MGSILLTIGFARSTWINQQNIATYSLTTEIEVQPRNDIGCMLVQISLLEFWHVSLRNQNLQTGGDGVAVAVGSVGKIKITHPPVITIFIGGTDNHSHKGGL